MTWLLVVFGCLYSSIATAQSSFTYPAFTAADSLRGTLGPRRTCFDVVHYDLGLIVDIADKSIRGSNTISYTFDGSCDSMQLDLFANMTINNIYREDGSRPVGFVRKGDAFFVPAPQNSKAGAVHGITIEYEGQPTEAANPPWDGGFVWQKDSLGRPWVAVACEGDGASLWFPCKDHLADEPDSVTLDIMVAANLTCVANGTLRSQYQEGNYNGFEWVVENPINSYNITLNIAHYAHFGEQMTTIEGRKLALDYYVLDYNKPKAKKHFEQVKPMMQCYEQLFGEYPFVEDGYALVETPYWGMEHQSAIAYGNNYKNNPFGFDFIIIHESGHEYWGNSVSTNDHGAMWIHEAFCTYAEALYLECVQDKQTATNYLMMQKGYIKNKEPIMGPLDVNYTGFPDADMYYRGSWMLHTLRHVVNDDELWYKTIKSLATDYRHQIVTSDQVISYLSQKLGKDLQPFFKEYLYQTEIPILEYEIKGKKKKKLYYRWQTATTGFAMPVEVKIGEQAMRLHPTQKWQKLKLGKVAADNLDIDKQLFYASSKKVSK